MTENKPLSVRSRVFEFGCESSERNVCNRLFGVSVGEFSVARVEFYFKNVGVGFVNRIISRFYRINGLFKFAWRNYLIAGIRSPPDEFHTFAGRNFIERNVFVCRAIVFNFNAAVVKYL